MTREHVTPAGTGPHRVARRSATAGSPVAAGPSRGRPTTHSAGVSTPLAWPPTRPRPPGITPECVWHVRSVATAATHLSKGWSSMAAGALTAATMGMCRCRLKEFQPVLTAAPGCRWRAVRRPVRGIPRRGGAAVQLRRCPRTPRSAKRVSSSPIRRLAMPRRRCAGSTASRRIHPRRPSKVPSTTPGRVPDVLGDQEQLRIAHQLGRKLRPGQHVTARRFPHLSDAVVVRPGELPYVNHSIHPCGCPVRSNPSESGPTPRMILRSPDLPFGCVVVEARHRLGLSPTGTLSARR